MNKIKLSLSIVSTALIFNSCAMNEMGVSAGMDLLKAATVSNEQMKSMAFSAAADMDAKSNVAPDGNKYAERLKRITSNLKIPQGLNLNYKVYLVDEINAFAMADGTVRVYSGLMDLMTDEELLFVMGHEIGHVQHEHSKQAYRVAYAGQATRKAAASIGGTTGSLAQGALGGLAEKLLNAQFSQSEETEADEFGLQFMKLNNINPNAAVSALKKLGGGESSMFSSHPGSADRAATIQSQI
ncbi:MAG: Putative metalloprotease yggG (EC [uncultured Sulfurovum sp.]|uniref:Metalloprotease yggG (EC) n=1 Tax=uncultured Sulfurovum sp. TaxID=269237 RepID=A0A6S6TSD3_9BACT|nr:MAG: Putative metalloprotease yggG (EC [uncultured Sulfurovum sp.]